MLCAHKSKIRADCKKCQEGYTAHSGTGSYCCGGQRIDSIYHLDNRYKCSSAKERLDNRQRFVKLLVDAYLRSQKHYRENQMQAPS